MVLEQHVVFVSYTTNTPKDLQGVSPKLLSSLPSLNEVKKNSHRIS